MKTPEYATPLVVSSLEECDFYHTMDLPNYGTVHGQWDLRGREATYLGNVDFRGKTVLEIGTGSGHLCFFMEREGAAVVAFDLSEHQNWDLVPFADGHTAERITRRKTHLRRLNKSFWLAHSAIGSAARLVYGNVYEIPDELGQFDIGICGSVLLHLRDPFLALQRIATHVEETIVITDVPMSFQDELLSLVEERRLVQFLPDATAPGRDDSWWYLSPQVVSEFLKILGFGRIVLAYHSQLYRGREVELFTLVGSRWSSAALAGESAALASPFSTGRIMMHLIARGWRGIRRRLRARGPSG